MHGFFQKKNICLNLFFPDGFSGAADEAAAGGDGDGCVQKYLFPSGCEGEECTYMARWNRMSPTEVEVEVR